MEKIALVTDSTSDLNNDVIEKVGKEVLLLCSQFPVPDHFIIPNNKNGKPA